MHKAFITIIGSLLLTLLISGCLEENKQITSESPEENSLSSIQDLINNASSGDTIRVPTGVYYENIVIDKSIILIGEHKETTIIEGSIKISTDNATLSNFTIKNAVSISVGEVESADSSSYFYDNTIKNNVIMDSSSAGIELNRAINAKINNNLIKNNEEGISLSQSLENTIYRNTIQNNEYGIHIVDNKSERNNIYLNNFINNTENAYDDGNSSWDYNNVGNYWSDYLEEYPEAIITNGAWNTPYNISGGVNNDSYPSVEIINEKPLVDFSYSPLSPTAVDVIQFNDDSEDTDGYIVWWLWAFGDGTTSTQRNPTHRYLDDGSYTVSLLVTDNLDETNEKSKIINVLNVEPSADFTINPKNPNDLDNISFVDQSTDSDGIIVSWYWDFGDSTFSAEKNTSHIYTDDGLYTVTLTVTDDDGAVDVVEKNIDVLNVGPAASFTFEPASPTIDDTVEFADHSSDSDGVIVTWVWDFDDGSTSSEQNTTHKFDEGKSYRVSLTVTDDDGASDSFTKYVDVAASYSSSDDTGKGYEIVYIIFFIFFVVIIVFVYYLSKKYKD